MIVYKCIITGDEIFSDSYKVNEVHDVLYEIEAKFVTEKEGGIDDSLIGGNKSAEEPDESAAADDSSKSGPNVALHNRYQDTGFGTKKEFLLSVKTYIKAALDFQKKKAADENREFNEEAFKAAHSAVVKDFIGPNFSEFQFYTGESMNPDGTIPMCLWKKKEGSDEETPFFYYFKAGLNIEKY